jgi:hypothetical protein
VRFERDWRNWMLVPVLVCCSMPFILALGHGQNTFTSLLLLALVVTAWRKRMPITAGLACGLLFYKPQLAAVVALILMLDLGIRVCMGLGFAAGVIFLFTGWTMPEALANYLQQLPLNLKYMQVDRDYLWEAHVTLKAFWRLLLQGREAGALSGVVGLLTTTSCALVALGLAGAWWRTRKPIPDDCWTGETRSVCRDRLIAATIAATPLLMPFYFDYDLLLLSVPAVLLAGEVVARPPGVRIDRLQRILIGAWIMLYVWLMVNGALAKASGVNVGVLLLGVVCALSILRAARGGARTSSFALPPVQHVTVKRAA